MSEEPSKISVRCNVNGVETTLHAYPFARLLDVLREELSLTGTKEGCGEAEGADIRTVEGLTDGERLHAVQQAMIECGGAQCGICTPGMVLAAVNLLKHTPRPTEADIREGLAGNLCRCTGYMKIFDAVMKAVESKDEGGRPQG